MRVFLTVIVFFGYLANVLRATPEPGVWVEDISNEHSKAMFAKSLYKGTYIRVKLLCHGTKAKEGHVTKVAIRFAGRMTQCQGEYNDIYGPAEQDRADIFVDYANQKFVKNEYVLYFTDTAEKWYDCNDNVIILKDHSDRDWLLSQANFTEEITQEGGASASQKTASLATIQRRKRAVTKDDTNSTKQQTTGTTVANPKDAEPADIGDLHRIAVTKEDGIYLFAFTFECAYFDEKTKKVDSSDTSCQFNISMTMEMHHPRFGYLSAIDWPELPFYATMCGIYCVFALTWISLCLYYWRELIRLQFWVAGVIFLGLVEKAIFLAEYQSVFATGLSLLPGAVVIAEIVSASKRALARILIVIVSVGFGIVRPRLGPVLNRVLVLGVIYFICATVEGCVQQLHPKGDNSNLILGSVLPLAIMDAVLCCWIFTSLVQTIRQLRVRRNVAKLVLYKHFTNVLIFAVFASSVYMVWSIVEHKLAKCLVDWKELWMDHAFWQMLFSTILLVIIILFRPSNNAVKYAFQPLPDNEEDCDREDEDEVIRTNLADDVKKKRSIDRSRERENSRVQVIAKENDDLKWVEENIPVAAEEALPRLLDSDEEIMASKYERNKME